MNKLLKSIFIILYTSLLSLVTVPSINALEIVDVELQLLIDISGSVSRSEYNLQMQGYKAAFESEDVQNAIINGTNGQIAVQLIMWSRDNQQRVMIDWTLIDSVSSADAFALTIDELARPFSSMTAIGEAITFSYPLFFSNEFESERQVMDISGDGENNNGTPPAGPSQDAIDAGVEQINGIVITTDQNVIDEYANDIVNGEGAFLLAPATFNDFQLSVQQKIVSEIEGSTPMGAVYQVQVPEPNTFILFFASFLFIIFKQYKTRN